jgi:hypothetical protein
MYSNISLKVAKNLDSGEYIKSISLRKKPSLSTHIAHLGTLSCCVVVTYYTCIPKEAGGKRSSSSLWSGSKSGCLSDKQNAARMSCSLSLASGLKTQHFITGTQGVRKRGGHAQRLDSWQLLPRALFLAANQRNAIEQENSSLCAEFQSDFCVRCE